MQGPERPALALKARLVAQEPLSLRDESVNMEGAQTCVSTGATLTGLSHVQFEQRRAVFHSVELATSSWEESLSPQNPDTHIDVKINFFDVGVFVDGPHRGERMVLAAIHSTGDMTACYGHCTLDIDELQRFAVDEHDGRMTILSRISDNNGFLTALTAMIPGKLGMSADADTSTVVNELESPGPNKTYDGACLTYFRDAPAVPIQAAVLEGGGLTPDHVYKSGREFWFTRVDGTAVSYYFRPPKFVVIGPYRDRYSCLPDKGKSEGSELDDPVVPDTGTIADSVLLATSAVLGDIFVLKSLNHPRVSDMRREWVKSESRHFGQSNHPLQSDSQYLSLNPIILWRDRFGEPFTCIYEPFINPLMAEPVIYLYPESPSDVRVAIGRGVRIEASSPRLFRNEWRVRAFPNGDLISSARRYKKLFWEGRSAVIGPPISGDVVAKAAVPAYLGRALRARGLSDGEIADFKAYWLPQMRSSPHYLIYFYDSKKLETIAPLKITPEPDSIIRVLMDFRPLEHPDSFPTADPPQPASRRGFVVVEWGGIKR